MADGGCRVVRAKLDVAEAGRDAFGSTVGEPGTKVLMMGVRLLEGHDGDATTQANVDKICDLVKDVVHPSEIPASIVENGVRHLATDLLVPSLGPVGAGIAFFAGKFAGNLTEQAFDSFGSGIGGGAVGERAIEWTDAGIDASIDRLAESDEFRDYVSDLLSKRIVAIIHSDTYTAARTETAYQMTCQPAAIRVLFVVYTEASGDAVASAGDSRAMLVPTSPFVLECVPEDAIVGLRLTDGTLVRRNIHEGRRLHRWARVSNWPVATTDEQQGEELPEQAGYEHVPPAQASPDARANRCRSLCPCRVSLTQEMGNPKRSTIIARLY